MPLTLLTSSQVKVVLVEPGDNLIWPPGSALWGQLQYTCAFSPAMQHLRTLLRYPAIRSAEEQPKAHQPWSRAVPLPACAPSLLGAKRSYQPQERRSHVLQHLEGAGSSRKGPAWLNLKLIIMLTYLRRLLPVFIFTQCASKCEYPGEGLLQKNISSKQDGVSSARHDVLNTGCLVGVNPSLL